jgi:exopolysaccharide production protein ExoY
MAAPIGARLAIPVGAMPGPATPAQGPAAFPQDRTEASGRDAADEPLAADDRIGDAVIRLLDIVGALCALVLASPVMLLVALSVWLTSPGPVLFAQRRIGRHGQAFSCLKFRTMTVDADAQLRALLDSDAAARAEWQRTQKLRRDPRVSPIGRFLRRTSLDELPQLFNVLAGSMSLVGPRPIVESEIARYGRHFAVYCQVRPGLTGLWQVQRDGSTSYRRRVAFDVAFARARSPRLYLLIIARTVPAVLTGRGAW